MYFSLTIASAFPQRVSIMVLCCGSQPMGSAMSLQGGREGLKKCYDLSLKYWGPMWPWSVATKRYLKAVRGEEKFKDHLLIV